MAVNEQSHTPLKGRRPGKTPEARENQLIAMAMDAAEKQIANGTASSQLLTHFLKLGCTKERIEKDRIVEQTKLIKAKADAIDSAKHADAMYTEALNAMKKYSGNGQADEEDD